MRIKALVLLLWSVSLHLSAQVVHQDHLVSSSVLHVDQYMGLHNDQPYNPTLFNFHTYEQINTTEFHLKYPIQDYDRYTFFIVFSYDNAQSILDISSDKNILTLSPTEIAARRVQKIELDPDHANIFMYSGNSGKKPRVSVESQFSIGNGVTKRQNGVVNIAEVLMLDRILKRSEAKMLQSKFAIKYGVSLPRDSTYLNSAGLVEFDPSFHGGFNHHVVALAKDEDLLVSQTTNTKCDFFQIGLEGILPVGTHSMSDVAEGSYLFISDNGGDLKFDHGDYLLRSWKLSGHLAAFKRRKIAIRLKHSHLKDFDETAHFHLDFRSADDLTESPSLSVPLDRVGDYLVSTTEAIPFERGEDVYVTLRSGIARQSPNSSGVKFSATTLTTMSEGVTVSIDSDEGAIQGSLIIYTGSGYHILSDYMTTSSNWQRQYELPFAGVYVLVFQSGNHYETRKIIVQ